MPGVLAWITAFLDCLGRLCAWVAAFLDSLGRTGESGSQSLAQRAIQAPLSHQSQSSVESSSTPDCIQINDSIYELHAPTSAGAVEMDILFFHGLQLEGTPDPHISTWQSRSAQREVWPGQWLSTEFPKARILSISYDNSLKQDDKSGRMDVYLVAENLLQNCYLEGVGQRSPVILVGHSFGGLVIKKLCVEAHRKQSKWPEIKTFFENVKGIFFFATPHHGSHFASAIEKLSSKEGDLLSLLKVINKDLARLNSEFDDIRGHRLVSGLGEALPTKLGSEFNAVVVEEASARCEGFFIVQEDHISICQPKARDSTTYKYLLDFIRRVKEKFIGEPQSYPLSTERGSDSYVPIHAQARDRIINGLENEQGPPVILLHGDPGSGKSVLARYIAESYARSCRESADSESIFLSGPHISPKLVIFLDCGQSAVSTVWLQKLHDKLHPQVHRSPGLCGSPSMCTLPVLMKGMKILVVLDDVWELELVEAFLEEVRGCDDAHVKFLVTSRISHVRDDPDILKVKTEEVTYVEAENILTSHLGLTSIPENLQEDAKFLVDRCERHPLALAMVASRITRDRREDPKQWKKVVEDYPALLRQQLYPARVREGKQDLSFGKVFHHAYERSIGETLMLTYKDLAPDARYLLLLIAKSGTSVLPRPVVRVLFACGVANHHKYCEPELFDDHLSKLENSGAMLRVSKRTLDERVGYTFYLESPNDKELSYESLGLHDLQKEFLCVLMEEDNKRLEKSLVPDKHCSIPLEDSGKMTPNDLDRATVWILCILWLQEDFAEKAAEKLGVKLPLFGSLSIPVLRDALEPLMYLMHEDFDDEMIHCAKQVMVQFFLYGGLDDQSLSSLLTCRDTVSATARMLLRLAVYTGHIQFATYNVRDLSLESPRSTSVPLMDVKSSRTHTPGTIQSLVHFLREKFGEMSATDDCPILRMALSVLVGLASLNVANRRMILADKDFFEDMRSYICYSNSGDISFHYNAALAWLYFTGSVNDESSFGSIVTVRESFKRLLKHILAENLFRDNTYLVMLAILCYRKHTQKLILLEFPDIVARLVKVLVNNGGDDLFISNVVAILDMLSKDNPDVQHLVGGTPGLIPKLLRILSSVNLASFQGNVGGLLNTLSSHQENRKAFLTAIPELLTVPSSKDHPALQNGAQVVLSTLSRSKENTKALLEVPDTVAWLLKLLVNSDCNPLLTYAAMILAVLLLDNADRRTSSRLEHQVGGTPGAIPKLLTSLWLENPPILQDNASALLSILSRHQEYKKALLEVPDIVPRLVKVLVNSGDDVLVSHVAAILSHLALDSPHVQFQIGETPGLIPKLLTCMPSTKRPDLHLNASRIWHNASKLLCDLSSHHEIRKAFLEVRGTAAQLVKLLVNTGDSYLLTHIVGILGNLSLENPDVQYQVGGIRGVIPKLLTILTSENPPDLHHGTATLLYHLSSRQENRKAFLEVPDTVAGLVELFVNTGHSGLLDRVVVILYHLSLENPDVQHQVGRIPGVIPKLLEILTTVYPLVLQQNAAAFFALLSSRQENRKAFLEVPDTVARIVGLLVNTGDSDLLINVVAILCNLSWENPDVQYQDGGTPGVIPKLLEILTTVYPPVLQRNAGVFLSRLSSRQENRKAFLEVPDTVARIVGLLVNTGDSDLLINVVSILGNLSLGNPDVQHQVGGTPGVIPKLMTVLTWENLPALHHNVAVLLCHLSSRPENRKAFLEVPDTVARIVGLLVNTGDSDLLINVVSILGNLSLGNPDVQHQVGGTPGVIPKLMTVLTWENLPALHHNVAVLLCHLSSRPENRKAFLEGPDTVAGLVGLLVNTGDNALLTSVLGILYYLSLENPDQVGGIPGVIPKLLTILTSENPPFLQHNAAMLLGQLSCPQENRKAFLEVPGTVASLLNLLVNSADDGVVPHVSMILINLAWSNPDQNQVGGSIDSDHVEHQIGRFPGAILKLLTMLSSPQLEHIACCLLIALCNSEDNRRLLSRTPDALEALVRLTVSSSTVELLEILCYLSKGNPSNQSRIGGFPGAITCLLTTLLCVDSSSVRLRASDLLFRLSSLQANRKLFLEPPEGLEELVKLFLSSESAELLSNLAGVLNNLLEENPALESQIGEIMLSNPRRRTFPNLYYVEEPEELPVGLRQAVHYEYMLFCLRFGFRAKKSLFFPGVSGSCDAVGGATATGRLTVRHAGG